MVNQLGNIMTRLQGLKNVRPRRVIPGAEFLENLEDENNDVSGTAPNLPNFNDLGATRENLPQADLGAELTPESYDVRANVEIPPEQKKGGSFWSNLGQSLGNVGKITGEQIANEINPKNYDVRANVPENIPVSQEANESLWNKLVPLGKMAREQIVNEINPEGRLPVQNVPVSPVLPMEDVLVPEVYQNENVPVTPVLPMEELNVPENVPISEELPAENIPITEEPKYENIPAIETPEMENLRVPSPQPVKEPGTYVELGAAQQAYNDPNASPELKAEIERIFDTKLTPQRNKEVKEFEKVVNAFLNKLEGVQTALNAREKALLKKVENRDLSTSEQISMALALVAPALIGGLIAGKQGIAGALAESGKNVGGLLTKRQEEIKEAEELLPQLALEKSQIAKEKMATVQQANELKRKINESVPNFALKQLFNKEGEIINGHLVLNTGNPLLPLKSTAVKTEKDYDNFRNKTMPKLTEKVSKTEQGLGLLDQLDSLLEHSEKNKQGILYLLPGYHTGATAMKAFIPATRDTFIDEDGNEVKISDLYENLIEQASDIYGQAVAASSKAAPANYREHFKKMLPNPFTKTAFLEGHTQFGTNKAGIKALKNKFEENIISTLDSVGVETTPMKEQFSKTKINTAKAESSRRKQRANAAVEQVLGE